MPIPVETLSRAREVVGAAEKPGPSAILTAAEGILLRILEGAAGLAFTRAELGGAIKEAALGRVGVELAPGFRDTVLALAQALIPALDREVQASTRVIDVALGGLVRAGRIGFDVHALEARYWAIVAPAPAPASGRALP